jgi:SM-20-related protein
MLNRNLNIPDLRRMYEKNAALSIQNILEPDVAQSIHAALVDLDWILEVCDYTQADKLRVPLRVPLREIAKQDNLLSVLDTAAHNLDRNKLFYMRLCVDDERFNKSVLSELSLFLKSEPFLNMARTVTGKMEITHSWLEATCYDRCCFLGGHRDDHHPGNLVAFVLNLTPYWQLDWGGLLMLRFPNFPPTIIPPYWNSLSLFSVPLDHLVSCVSPAAAEKRYAITGWFRR